MNNVNMRGLSPMVMVGLLLVIVGLLMVMVGLLTSCGGKGSNTNEICGNGVVAGGEGCDDGNIAAGDGCDAQCAVEQGWECSGAPAQDGVVLVRRFDAAGSTWDPIGVALTDGSPAPPGHEPVIVGIDGIPFVAYRVGDMMTVQHQVYVQHYVPTP
jgi:cysteine-rich repeat protein